MKTVVHFWQSSYPREVRVEKINKALIDAGMNVAVVARHSKNEPKRSVSTLGEILFRVGLAKWPLFFSLPLPGNFLWNQKARQAAKELGSVDLVIARDIPLGLSAAKFANEHSALFILDMAEHYPAAMRSWKKYSTNKIMKFLVHSLKLPDLLERAVVNKAHGILVVCDEQKERLKQQYGYPDERICVVRNTPTLGFLKTVPHIEQQSPPTVFAYHGILCQDRQLETILKGFDIATQSIPLLRLLIAGTGEIEHELRSYAKTLPSRDKITFTGRYSLEQLPSLYSQTDFGIVSLEDNEFTRNTLANKFFDYAGIGKPFLYTNLPPLQHVMKDLQCGKPYQAGDASSVALAMLELARGCHNNPVEYQSMVQRGQSGIQKKYHWELDSARMLSFLQGLNTAS